MYYLCTRKRQGALVQLVRIHACHAWGHGFESRTHRTVDLQKKTRKGRLAQLVQSVCLTSRGSAVRIRQRPRNFRDTKLYTVYLSVLRTLSSAGSERLPYKQRVGGSNPSAPTNRQVLLVLVFFLFPMVI